MKAELLEKQVVEHQGGNGNEEGSDENGESAPQYAGSLTLDACRCRHLEMWLPHILNLECVPTSNKGSSSWKVTNPVHALHLASHLQSDGATVVLPKGHPAYAVPALFGDEQRRTDAITSPGIADSYCPLVPLDHSTARYTTTETIPPKEASPKATPPKRTESSTPAIAPAVTSQSFPVDVFPFKMDASSFALQAAKFSIPNVTNVTLLDIHKVDPVNSDCTGSINNNDNTSSAITDTSMKQEAAEPTPPELQSSEYLLTEDRFLELRRMEELILQQRRTALSKRKPLQSNSSKKKGVSTVKKRKRDESKGDVESKTGSAGVAQVLPGSFLSSLARVDGKRFTVRINQDRWDEDTKLARSKVEEWMERFRLSRCAYWDEKRMQSRKRANISQLRYGDIDAFNPRQCQTCVTSANRSKGGSCSATGDELMQCLECSFVGCGPCSVFDDSSQHMMHHMLERGHSFAVTCGAKADLFCFDCGDFVYHQVFDQEKERIDIAHQFPLYRWNEHPVQRSFDSLQFLNTTDHGLLWRGLVACYPSLVPNEHIEGARLSMRRLSLFRGEVDSRALTWGPQAQGFAIHQQLQGPDSWRIRAPVGMYNLGNTCFMSCIIQCLMNCVPLQRHFLRDIGHHHKSCRLLRRSTKTARNSNISTSTNSMDRNNGGLSANEECLACELDVVFLKYFGSSIGKDVLDAVCEPVGPADRALSLSTDFGKNENMHNRQGEPLTLSDLLTAAWKSGGMDHLAGYEQRDAHEFLQAFLYIVGKHASQHQQRIDSILEDVAPFNAKANGKNCSEANIVKRLFEGTLRSVLICEECGCKRSLPETFLNISLPLSKQVDEDLPRSNIGTRLSKLKISVQRCLDHFTAPETLADPVDCPSCKKKTATKKQHTFAKLPKVLCLHLKRFDAAKNRKIIDFVSFPEYGLDLGPLLPHWCEIPFNSAEGRNRSDEISSPQILYDLFATVNHTGTLNQGHYVSNVKVDGQWYHCNDAHVSKWGDGDGSSEVLKSEAYMLFYTRR